MYKKSLLGITLKAEKRVEKFTLWEQKNSSTLSFYLKLRLYKTFLLIIERFFSHCENS